MVTPRDNAAPSAPAPADDRPHPLQIEAWRAMGPAGRTRMGIELRENVRRWKHDALRRQHPEWSESHLLSELAKIYLRGNT
jgi:hypothetical protein